MIEFAQVVALLPGVERVVLPNMGGQAPARR
jgi:hypothetical protein